MSTITLNNTTELTSIIEKYLAFEKMPLREAYWDIERALDISNREELYDHMCGKWKSSGKKDFSHFFLNADARFQIGLLNVWGFYNEGENNYLKQLEAATPAESFELEAPERLITVILLLKFFYNNGIDKTAINGITITKLPRKEKRFGNGTNWGRFILSLSHHEQDQVLKAILNNH